MVIRTVRYFPFRLLSSSAFDGLLGDAGERVVCLARALWVMRKRRRTGWAGGGGGGGGMVCASDHGDGSVA